MSASHAPPLRRQVRRRVLLGFWVASALVLGARAGVIQLVQGARWEAAALDQHRETLAVPAPRGAILDRNGIPLVESRELYRIGVAPRELKPGTRREVVAQLASMFGLPPRTVQALEDTAQRWVVLRGKHPPQVREALEGIRGVYLERELDRLYHHEELARGVMGNVQDGEGKGGIEGILDGHLRGTPGRQVEARDSEGRPIPGQSYLVQPPVPGGSVVLTLDRDLQEIGQEALREAVERTGARGGDLIVSDPKTGEILALVSLRDGSAAGLSALNDPYEPGSTLKPFTVAGVLLHGAGALGDSVETENGRWTVEGRTISDVHPYGKMTVEKALKVSSNVGVAKAAQGLSRAQQYEILRDFGFGTPTGVELPGEAAGTLRRPSSWSRQSQVSLAIGYEIAVTPLQMVMAYGALANGGKLMEPRLVKELRDPQGRATRFGARVVREVIPPALSRELTRVLAEVVEEGTGRAAQLATFAVAGKSGTSRAYGARGGYEAGGYYSSFVGFFPVEDPQLVVYVKLERPRGVYYGGATAAPVTRATMEAVLAARQAPIDREALASLTRRQPRTSPTSGAFFASLPPSPPPSARAPRATPPPEAGVLVPDVSGQPARQAVRLLHSWGLRVILEAPGSVSGTHPAAGTPVAPGDTVRLITGRSGDG